MRLFTLINIMDIWHNLGAINYFETFQMKVWPLSRAKIQVKRAKELTQLYRCDLNSL